MRRCPTPDATDRLTADELALRLGDRPGARRPARRGRGAGAGRPGHVRPRATSIAPGCSWRSRRRASRSRPCSSASRSGRISLRYYDELHPPPGRLSGRTYGEFAASLGPARAHLAQLFAAFGIAEPDRGTHLATGDEALVAELLEIVVASGQPGPRAAGRADVRRGRATGRRCRARRLRRGGAADGRRPHGPPGRLAVRAPAPAVGPVRPAQRAARGLARRPPPHPRDRRVQRRRDGAHPAGHRPHRRAARGAARRRLRRPHRLHAPDRGARATRRRPRSRCGSATSRRTSRGRAAGGS